MATNIIQQYLNANRNDENQCTFTYDEGKGTKDNIAITGPLSEVYTHALNVVFTKKDIADQDQDGSGVVEKMEESLDNKLEQLDEAKQAPKTLSQESQVLDGALNTKVVEAILRETNDVHHLQQTGFIDAAAVDAPDPKDTTATAFFVDKNEALRPETVEQIQQSADSGRRTMLVVVAEPAGMTHGMRLTQSLIEVESGENLSYADTELAMATESLYTSHGVQVFRGVGAFVRSFAKKK